MNNKYKALIFIFILALFAPILTNAKKHTNQNCPLETQTAVKATGSASVYYITKDCTKRAFENPKVFFSYFKAWSEVKEVPAYKVNSIKKDKLGFMPWGPKKDFKSGTLVKTVNDTKVYVLLGNEKCWLKNQTVFNQLNYKFDWIVDVDPRVLDKYKSCSEPISYTDHHPPGTLIKYPDSNDVYVLKKQKDKIKKKLIKNEQEFNQLGYRWDRILTVNPDETYSDYSQVKTEEKDSSLNSEISDKKATFETGLWSNKDPQSGKSGPLAIKISKVKYSSYYGSNELYFDVRVPLLTRLKLANNISGYKNSKLHFVLKGNKGKKKITKKRKINFEKRFSYSKHLTLDKRGGFGLNLGAIKLENLSEVKGVLDLKIPKNVEKKRVKLSTKEKQIKVGDANFKMKKENSNVIEVNSVADSEEVIRFNAFNSNGDEIKVEGSKSGNKYTISSYKTKTGISEIEIVYASGYDSKKLTTSLRTDYKKIELEKSDLETKKNIGIGSVNLNKWELIDLRGTNQKGWSIKLDISKDKVSNKEKYEGPVFVSMEAKSGKRLDVLDANNKYKKDKIVVTRQGGHLKNNSLNKIELYYPVYSISDSEESAYPREKIKLEPVTKSDWQRGSEEPQVRIVEYTGLESPFGKRFHSTMQKVVKDYENRVQWVYRHFPLEKLHSKAFKESRAAECVGQLSGEDKFWAFVDKIFEVTPSNNGLELSKLPEYASEVGVNKNQFEQCYEGGKYKPEVQEDLDSGKKAGVNGTPYSILVGPNGSKRKVSGAQPYEKVEEKIEELLSNNN